jgi:hypothetical protein
MHLRQLFLAILLACTSLDTAISAEPSAEVKEFRPDKNKETAAKKTPDTKQNSDGIPDTRFEKSIVEALNKIADEQKSADDKNEAGQKSWDSPTIRISIYMAIIGSLYTLFAVWQWLAIKRQVNLERPWVTIYPRRDPVNWPFSVEGQLRIPPFHVEVIWDQFNYGRSPAFVNKFSVSLRILNLPLSETRPPYKPSDDIAPLFLAPNGAQPHDSRLIKQIGQDKFNSIIIGEKAIVLFGFLEYEDTIHKKQHISRFCFQWFYDDGRPTYSPVGPKDWIEYT